MKTFTPGQIVEHTLTNEKFIVLNDSGKGIGYDISIKVRGCDYKEYYFQPNEINPCPKE